MRFIGKLLAATLGGAVILLAVPGGAASAAPLPQLPITDLTQFIANAGHHHLFFLDDGALIVTDLKGTQVAALYGGEASAIATDGRTVYVVLGRGGQEAVAAISAATLAQTALYTLPQGDVPYSVAVQAGKIWVSYSGDNPVGGAIGYFEAGAAAFTPTR